MTKPAILCSCRLLNHHFVYLLSERNTSHSHPRNCLGDSSVECLRDGRLPPSWQQRSCHQYNAKSVTNTHKTRKMALLSQAAAAAHSSLPWTEERCLEALRPSRWSSPVALSALVRAAASHNKHAFMSQPMPERPLALCMLHNVYEVRMLVRLSVSASW